MRFTKKFEPLVRISNGLPAKYRDTDFEVIGKGADGSVLVRSRIWASKPDWDTKNWWRQRYPEMCALPEVKVRGRAFPRSPGFIQDTPLTRGAEVVIAVPPAPRRTLVLDLTERHDGSWVAGFEYDVRAIALVKEYGRGRWDPQRKQWVLPTRSDAGRVARVFKDANADVHLWRVRGVPF
ncbi:hypothetical protein HUN08_01855 [Gordonia sp. X0973]|uniref:hypothetical protein n=1 Tax=Gordonia sp. X0973 TaxID=2742602 RepID=UPI000F53AC81|nr:hypothetical protein [Gordonia sp. X0973]QKT06074.1 hypothetical protein HUN08_01855 [Gordonia sp. X0973]